MWTIDNIRKIVAAVGDLMEVDNDVEHMQRLDCARVLVRTPRPPLIQQVVEVHVGGETYHVHMVEETAVTGRITGVTRKVDGSLRRRLYRTMMILTVSDHGDAQRRRHHWTETA